MGFTAKVLPVYGFYMYGPRFMSSTAKIGPVPSDFPETATTDEDIVYDRAEKVQAYWREITGNDKISVTHAMHDVAEDLQVKLGTEKAYFALIGVSCVDTKDGEINTGYTSGSGFRDRDPSDFTIGDVNAMTTREIRAIIDRHDEIGKERFKEVDWEFFLGSADVEDIKTAECHYQMTDCLCCS
jgi:hypothetical protein